jgi:hypothetical protein
MAKMYEKYIKQDKMTLLEVIQFFKFNEVAALQNLEFIKSLEHQN